MFRITTKFILLLQILFTSGVRVYENQEEEADISGNVNSTGPVIYPDRNMTEAMPMMPPMNRTMLNMMNANKMNRIPVTTMAENETMSIGLEQISQKTPIENSTTTKAEAEKRAKIIPKKVKGNSFLKSRQPFRPQKAAKPITTFVSSPADIATRIASQSGASASASSTDSFQPMMINKSPPLTQPHQHHHRILPPQLNPKPPPQYNSDPIVTRIQDQSQLNSAKSLVQRETPLRDYQPTEYPIYPPQFERPSGPQQLEFNKFQQTVPNDIDFKDQLQGYNGHFVQTEPKPITDNKFIAWPEPQQDQKYPIEGIWTTEQPEVATNSYKYYPTPTEYEPPKGFLSNAFASMTQSLRPSTPSHPYPFEISQQYQKSHFTPADSHHSVPYGHSDIHGNFEKYEIITTVSPQEHQFSQIPSTTHFHHEHEIMRPSHHNHPLPWYKIIKALSAIIPFGLLVSALTPNVVLINPNATNARPAGNLFSFISRQRSVDEPETQFDEKIMKMINALNDQHPQSGCIKRALCQALSSNQTASNLSGEEYRAFQERVCKSNETQGQKC